MVGTRRLEALIAEAVNNLRLPEGPLVVGLSGGADSAALAFLCVQLDRPMRAVHVDHGLPASPMLRSAATEIANKLALDLEVVEVEVPPGASPEGQARRARYGAFAESLDSGERLLTAHTRDDEVETVVFNLIRGTGSRGLAGIPYYRPASVFRPALGITRSQTREVATLAGLPFSDDPMNEDPTLTRNVIRSRVIPMMSELNPRFSESVARMAEAVAADNDHLDHAAAQIPVLFDEAACSVAVGNLTAAPRPVADRVLKTILSRAVGAHGVTAERVDSMWAVVTGETKAVQIAGPVEARISGASLVLRSTPDSIDNRTIELLPGVHRQGGISFDILASDDVCLVAPLSRWQSVFPRQVRLQVRPDGVVLADGEEAWLPGKKRLPVAWYEPGTFGYLSVFATEVSGWT